MRPSIPLALLLTCACDAEPEPEAAAPWARPLAERAADPFPRRTAGPDGPVTVPAPPRDIVAASLLSAEVLLDIAPRERLRAIHGLAADPAYGAVHERAAAFPRRTSGDPEHILSLEPDLVFVDPYTSAETVALLGRGHAPLVRPRPFDDFGDVRDNIRLIGYAAGLDRAAEELVVGMDARLARAEGRVAGRELRAMNLTANMFTYGRGSLLDAMLRWVGAENLAAVHGAGPYQRVTAEMVLSWDPDVLVVGVPEDGAAAERQRLREHPALGRLECVRRGRVVTVPRTLLDATSHHVARAVVRLADGLEALPP